jgi:hypothetical protein
MFTNTCANVGNKTNTTQAFPTYVDRYIVSGKKIKSPKTNHVLKLQIMILKTVHHTLLPANIQ